MIVRQIAFRQGVVRACNDVISKLRPVTVGISEDCLWQLSIRSISKLPSAPEGTNGAWAARQVFNEVVRSAPFNRFVYRSEAA